MLRGLTPTLFKTSSRFLFYSSSFPPPLSSPFNPPPSFSKRSIHANKSRHQHEKKKGEKKKGSNPFITMKGHEAGREEFWYDLMERDMFEWANQNKDAVWWRRRIGLFCVVAGLGWYVNHLEQVPVSGRQRFIGVSIAREEEIAYDSFRKLQEKHKAKILPPYHYLTRQVDKVGRKIVATSPTLKERNYEWEFFVVDDQRVVNAFVLPNGKCFVYMGLLDLCDSDDELAMIVGHEVAHVVARHAGERLSLSALRKYFSFVLVLFGLDVNYDILDAAGEIFIDHPQSRENETEADQIGLILAKRAGYDITAAVTIWKKMTKRGYNESDFLSTHPSDKRRIKNIEKLVRRFTSTDVLVYDNQV